MSLKYEPSPEPQVARSHYKGVARGVRQKVSEGGGMRGTVRAPVPKPRL